MLTYKLLSGRIIDLQALTPAELFIYHRFLELSGGHELLVMDDQEKSQEERDEDAKKTPVSPWCFFWTCETIIDRTLFERSAQVKRGPLGEIALDLTLRMSIRRGDQTLSETRYHPRNAILNEYNYGEFRGSDRFMRQSGMSYKEMQKYFKRVRSSGLEQFSKIAEKLQLRIETHRGDASPRVDALTMRDYSLATRSMRLYEMQRRFPKEFEVLSSGEAIASGLDREFCSMLRSRSAELQTGKAVIVVFPADARTSADLDWLFLGIELCWFECAGFLACVCPEEASESLKGLEGYEVVDVEVEGLVLPQEKGHWGHVLAELYLEPTARPTKAPRCMIPDPQAWLKERCNAFRRCAYELWNMPEIPLVAKDVSSRWRKAFGCPTDIEPNWTSARTLRCYIEQGK